jgi:hypothetical protein
MPLAAALMLMLAPAASSADAVGQARKTYSKCVSDLMQPSIDSKLSLADFQAAIKSKCAAQETSFRTAVLASDKADGMKEDEAQKDADDQIAEYVDKFTADYEEYLK